MQPCPNQQALPVVGQQRNLEQTAEELKKLRKAGKSGVAKQVLAKVKVVSDKVKEIDGLQDQLAAKPEHMFLGNLFM